MQTGGCDNIGLQLRKFVAARFVLW